MILTEKIKKWYTNESGYITLTNAINGGRLCHAYLFLGEDGVGKKTLAFTFAMAIFCKSEDKPCFECDSCKKMLTNNHPDFFSILDKTAKNSIHIEPIRNMKSEAYIKANESEYKIYLIENAHNMSIGAANAFLKLLEEPPKNTIFLLTAPNKKSVLSTIYSRCIPFLVYPLTINQCVEILVQKFSEINIDKLNEISLLTDGNIGQAIDVLNDAKTEEYLLSCQRIYSDLISHKEYDMLLCITKLVKDRKSFISLLNIMLLVLRQLLLQKNMVNNDEYGQFLEYTQEISYKYTINQLISIYDLIEEYIINIENNINLNLLINHFCSKLSNDVWDKKI